MNKRLERWKRFSSEIEKHTIQYANVQYGNKEGDEQIDIFATEDCWQNMQRYYNRRNSGFRGDSERLRDVLKIAHYAQEIFLKICDELEVDGLYKNRFTKDPLKED